MKRSPDVRVEVLNGQLLQHRVLVALLGIFVIAGEANAASWTPWSEAVFAKARREDKPILLSVGYRGCFHCAPAEVSEPAVIAVSLDRDVRPEIADAFRLYARETGGRQDVPAYILLTPHLEPVAAINRGEEFQDFLTRALSRWKGDRASMIADAGLAARRLRLTRETSVPVPLDDTPLTRALRAQTLIRSGNEDMLREGAGILRSLVSSPLFDPLGGGFHHRARDAAWTMPQFEKRLEDQATMAIVYTEAWQITGEPLFAQVARAALGAIVRDFRDKKTGLFWNALGADSLVPRGGPQMVEGGHYVWEASEIRNLLGARTGDIVLFHFGARPEGNVATAFDRAGEFRGRNLLFPAHTLTETAVRFSMGIKELEETLNRSVRTLAEVRFHRPPPSLDGRVFTSTNGMAVSALARGGVVFEDAQFSAAAVQAARVLARLKPVTRTEGVDAVLDDYAFLIRALLDAFEASFDVTLLNGALQLQKRQDELFWDEKAGRYRGAAGPPAVAWLARDESRTRTVLAENLGRLADIAGNEAWRTRAAALDPGAVPVRQVIIAGNGGADDTRAMLQAVRRPFAPRQMVFLVDSKASRQRLEALMPYIKGIVPNEKRAVATVCENRSCRTATTEVVRILAQ